MGNRLFWTNIIQLIFTKLTWYVLEILIFLAFFFHSKIIIFITRDSNEKEQWKIGREMERTGRKEEGLWPDKVFSSSTGSTSIYILESYKEIKMKISSQWFIGNRKLYSMVHNEQVKFAMAAFFNFVNELTKLTT